MRIVSWRAALTATFFSARYAGCPSSPAAWNVPTFGASAPSSAAPVGPGTSGSCRCTTSGRKLRNASSVRSDASFWAWAIGEIEPLLTNRTLGPTDVTPGSGGGPSHGPITRASTPEGAQRAGQPQHLALDATRRRQRVRRDDRDLHRRASDVRRPVGLHQVPLLGGQADELLEPTGELLGDAGDIVAQSALALHRQRWPDLREVPTAGPEVHAGRHERRTGAERERGRTARHRGALAEELDRDPVTGEVAVAEQADDPVRLQRPQHRGTRVGAEGHDLHADRLAHAGEPLEELRRLDRLDDDRRRDARDRRATRPRSRTHRGAGGRG